MNFSIQDYQIKLPVLIAHSVKIEVIQMELNKSVRLRVYFMKKGENYDEMLTVDTMDVVGEDYAAWGDDDSYLETLVINKYGLVKKE
jgi:hypothetical protein